MNSTQRWSCVVATLCAVLLGPWTAQAARPNVLIILCDDLGWGDVRAFNAQSKIPTPHMDALAQRGMRFTDAHSGSAVCTPTRYGLLTGRYCWRTRLQDGVLGGISRPLLPKERPTLATLLQAQGYRTACIGKWHLGLDFTVKPGTNFTPEDRVEKGADGWNFDYTQPLRDGPRQHGFDYFFGISGSLDMVPYTFIENDHVVAQPTQEMSFPMMLGRPEAMTRPGPGAPGFQAKEVLPTLARKAVDFLGQQKEQDSPFLLYLPLTSPHTPIAPSDEWQAKSGLNPYADFVQQTDAVIGEVLAALERNGLAHNTLVIVTSDNGCSPKADFPELEAKGHFPSGPWRDTKADIMRAAIAYRLSPRGRGRFPPERKPHARCALPIFLPPSPR